MLVARHTVYLVGLVKLAAGAVEGEGHGKHRPKPIGGAITIISVTDCGSILCAAVPHTLESGLSRADTQVC